MRAVASGANVDKQFKRPPDEGGLLEPPAPRLALDCDVDNALRNGSGERRRRPRVHPAEVAVDHREL